VGNIIRKHFSILQSNPKLKELFPRSSIIPSFRRSKNLKEFLTPSGFKTVEEGQTTHQNNGCFKCCLLNPNHFLVFRREKKYTIHSRLSCDSKKILFIWLLASNVVGNMWDLPLPILELGFVIISLLCSQTKQLVK